MHAIVRKGNGEYYVSVILGCYADIPNDYTHRYFLVLNEEKDKIIKQPMFNPNKKPYLDQMVLLIDDNQSDWVIQEDGYGCVNLFDKKTLLDYAYGKDIPLDLINECKKLDSQYMNSEYNEIKNQTDIDRFMLIPFTQKVPWKRNNCTDWEGMLKALRSIKYRGAISFETHCALTDTPKELIPDILKLISGIGRYFRAQIEK